MKVLYSQRFWLIALIAFFNLSSIQLHSAEVESELDRIEFVLKNSRSNRLLVEKKESSLNESRERDIPFAAPLCGILSMPFVEDFNTWPPSCVNLIGGTQVNTQYANASGSYAVADFWGWSSGNWSQMETDPIAINTAAQVKLDWSHLAASSYPLDQLLIQIFVDTPSAPVITILDLNGPSFTTTGASSTMPTTGLFSQSIAAIPTQYIGQNVRIRIRANSGFGPRLFMDNLRVEAIPSCPEPTALSAFNLNSTTANLSWLFSGTPSNGWSVEWGPVGFTQGTGTVVASPNDTLKISGLAPLSSYDFYVQQDCGAIGKSNWAGPFTFTTLSISCPPPTGVSSLLSSNSATLFWLTGGAANFQYVFGPSNTSSISGTLVSGSGSSVSFSGLTPSTLYDFWIRDSCGVGDVSAWTGPFNFSTLCAPISIPYLRDFNGVNFPPLCWDLSGGSRVVTQSNGQFLEAGFWSWFGGEWAQTNTQPILVNQDAQVKFRWAHLHNSSYPNDQMLLLVRLASSTTYDTLINLKGPGFNSPNTSNINPPPSADFIEETILLDPIKYTGQELVFSFRFYSGYGPNVYVDDFSVDAIHSCPEPNQLNVITTNSTTAVLGWTSGDSTASSWFIEYGPNGFLPGTGTTVSASSNPFTLVGLLPSTEYNCFVRELCQNGIDTSSYSFSTYFTTQCLPAPMPYLADFNGSNFPPLCWDLSGGTRTVLQRNSEFLEASFWNWQAGNWAQAITQPINIDEKARVKFKWAHRHNAAYPDQMLLMVRLASSPIYDTLLNKIGPDFHSPNSANVLPPPSSDFIEELIFLDSAKYTGQDVIFAFRFNSGFGPNVFVDDFVVEPVPSCPEPRVLSVVSTGETTATLEWDNGDSTANTWFIEYGPVGFFPGTGTTVSVSSNPATISGLLASTLYGFNVRELCENGVDTSGYSSPSSFITLCGTFSAPFLETFTGTAPGIIGTYPFATSLLNCWDIAANSDGLRWETEDASGLGENSFGTGPWFDNTTPNAVGGMYVYLETSTGTSANPAMFTSPLVHITSLSTPTLSFAYHMYGASTDTLRVDVWGNNSGAWTNNVWSIYGQQQTAGSDPWIMANVSLNGFGDTIQVRFAGRKGSSFTGDIALDDISIDNFNCSQVSLPRIHQISNVSQRNYKVDLSLPAGGELYILEVKGINETSWTSRFPLVQSDTLRSFIAPVPGTKNLVRLGIRKRSIWTYSCVDTIDVECLRMNVGTNELVLPICASDSAIVKATVSGGFKSKSFLWNNGKTTQFIYGQQGQEYSVVVTDEAGCSDSSSIVLSTYNGQYVPMDFAVTKPGPTSFSCSWNAPSLDTGVSIIGYRVRYRRYTNPRSGIWTSIPLTTANTVLIDFTGLGLAAANYEFQVFTRVNDNGNIYNSESSCFGRRYYNGVSAKSELGLIHNSNGSIVRIYPNPFSDFITIEATENSQIEVLNGLGQVVYSFTSIGPSSLIDLGGLAKGAYLVKLVNGNSVLTERILKY